MFDFNHLFPQGAYSNPNKKAKTVRTPEEMAESLLRWKCSEYAPMVQCHLCDDCKPSKLCGLCQDLKDAVSLLLEGARSLGAEAPVESECHHHRITRDCPVCGPQPKGAQD